MLSDGHAAIVVLAQDGDLLRNLNYHGLNLQLQLLLAGHQHVSVINQLIVHVLRVLQLLLRPTQLLLQRLVLP